MGQGESVAADKRRASKFGGEAARFQIRSTSKAPSKIIIEKPKVQDSKPILQVPHTNVKIMHVDPTERAGIVPTHGYIALQIVPPDTRADSDYDSLSPSLAGSGGEGRSKKRGRHASPRKRRSSSLKGATAEEVAREVVDAGMDPEYLAMLQRAREEYSEEGHRQAAREVKKWKAAFALENGRHPNKKDIANTPYIFEQYYREKEFDAMKKLIDENAEAEREEAAEGGQTNLIRELTALDVARSEYNAMEFLDLHREVKRWKIEFKATHGRQPSKKDVSDAPEIFDKYYRVKELEAMKRLMDDAEAVEKALAASDADGGGGGAFAEEHASASAFDPVENAKAQFDAAELAQLSHDVRRWKMEFKASRGRPPTKRDISEDPEMFTMYYREKELEAMKKLIEDTQASMRRASVIDGLEALDRAKTEYDAAEHETLQREVKEWKRAFKLVHGRPPTKRDIAADPEAFTKYYREKELETMQQLTLEASERPLAMQRSNSVRRSSSIVKFEDGSAEHEGSRRDSKRRRSEQPADDAMDVAAVSEAGGADFPLPTDNPQHVLSFVEDSIAAAGDGVSNHPPAPGYTAKAPQPLGGFAPRFEEGKPMAGSTPPKKPTLDPFDIDDALGDEDEDVQVATQFVFPRGHQAAERVFFFDTALQLDEKGAAMLGMPVQGVYDPVAAAHKYEVEEDEIYEMAGIHRPQATALDEDDDPLATYELHSNVLEALRLAIDAPMSDFGGASDAVYDAALQSFIEEAMHEAHDLFEEERVKDEAYQKTYSMAHMAHTKSSRAGMGRKLMSKVKSRAQSAMRMHMTAFEEPTPTDANSSSPGTMADNEDDEYAGWSHEDMVRERKQLHKLLNNYKNQFIEHHGRGPEAFEMAQDPQVRDAYAQYHILKKKTKSKLEAVVDAAVLQADVAEAPSSNGAHADEESVEAAAHPQQGFNPFAKVLEMNESAARRDRLLEPIGGVEAEVVMSPQEQELDILSKEMKIWKRGFKEREGRNPTRRDIKQDADFAEKYFRMKELESILGKEGSAKKKRRSQQHDDEDDGHDDDEGHDGGGGHEEGPPTASEGEGGSPSRTPRKAQRQHLQRMHENENIDTSLEANTAGHGSETPRSNSRQDMSVEDAIDRLVQGEQINRRDVEADEDIAVRLMWGQGMSVGLRVGALSHREEPVDAGQDDVGAAVNATIASYRAFADESEGPADAPNGDRLRPLPAHTPVLDLADGVQERPQPGATPGPTAVTQGWSFPMDDAATAAGGATAPPAEADEVTDEAGETPQLTPEEVREQRKAVAKELNQWKAHFKMVNSKAPTAKDIKQHPHVQALFEKYQVLTKAVEALEAAEAAAKEKESAHPAPLTLSKHPSSRSASPQAVLVDEDGAPLTPLRTAKHHRQRLAKEISEWRIAFRVQEGHAPVLKDIVDTPQIAAAYEEYTQLNDYVAEREGRARGGIGAEADVNETVALALRRKQLGRTLNEWKAQFFDTYGRNPNVRDIKTNKQASAMYEEYNLIPKNVEDDAAHQLEMEDRAETNDEEVQVREAKVRKKELNKILNEWKAQFAESMGRKPKVSDILADAVVAAVYGEYQELQAALQDAKERPGATGHDASQTQESAGPMPPTTDPANAWTAAPNDAQQQLTAATDEGDNTATTPERPQTPLAKQKKRVTKQLNQWKSEFAAREGRNPTKADIKKDDTAFALFQSYQSLKEQLKGTGGDGGGEDGDGGNEDPTDGASPQPVRGALGAWSETPQPPAGTVDGTSPAPAGSEASPPQVSPPPHANTETPPVEDQPQADAPANDVATLKAMKKTLNKRLNTWKLAFTEEHGKAPKQTDIQQNSEMLALYEELKALKLQLKHMEGDGGED